MAGVLDVAVQSDNFCLFYQTGNWFFCHTKSEWAAWVQAIFSVIAILGSFGIVIFQNHLNKKNNNEILLKNAKASALIISSSVKKDRLIFSSFNKNISDAKDFKDFELIRFVQQEISRVEWPSQSLMLSVLPLGYDFFDLVVTPYKRISSLDNLLKIQLDNFDKFDSKNKEEFKNKTWDRLFKTISSEVDEIDKAFNALRSKLNELKAY